MRAPSFALYRLCHRRLYPRQGGWRFQAGSPRGMLRSPLANPGANDPTDSPGRTGASAPGRGRCGGQSQTLMHGVSGSASTGGRDGHILYAWGTPRAAGDEGRTALSHIGYAATWLRGKVRMASPMLPMWATV